MNEEKIPHIKTSKTLEIIKFYNKVYDFTNKYLIFVVAGIIGLVTTLILRMWEPENPITHTNIQQSTFINKEGSIDENTTYKLLYPVNYFASQAVSMVDIDGDKKVYALGGPARSINDKRNSVDNIIHYNGIILPRQISNSSWVPALQGIYNQNMIKTLLEGMATSKVDIQQIESFITKPSKKILESNLFDTFTLGCIDRVLVARMFCDLKLYEAMQVWEQYDLTSSINELQLIQKYVMNGDDSNAKETFCTEMIKQYRFNASAQLVPIMNNCNEDIQNEITYISNLIKVSEETQSDKFTNNTYSNPIINRYKLMSRYQYFMYKITTDDYIGITDNATLMIYDSYITKLAHSNTITAPYGDIIYTFHTEYLLPWLKNRTAFATSAERDITNTLETTTKLIIEGSTNQGLQSILSGGQLQAQISGIDNTTPPEQEKPILTDPNSTTSSGESTSQETRQINTLIESVLGITPTTITKRDQIIIVQFTYQGYQWFAAIDMTQQGQTQLFFNSPQSGAVKIEHNPIVFIPVNKTAFMTVLDQYRTNNPQ